MAMLTIENRKVMFRYNEKGTGNDQYPGGNAEALQRSIIEKIFKLPDATVLFSGHSEQTTVGVERGRYRY